MPDLVLNGARIHYEDTVDGGEPIVFAHGLLWSGAMYRFQVEAFRARRRCITFDFRGQGRSEVAPVGYDMDSLTDDAIALVEALGIAPVHWVGVSMGGFVGLRLALRRPDLVRSLALVESAADAEPRKNIPKYLAMAAIARLGGIDLLVDRVMAIMFGRSFLADPTQAALRDELREELRALDRVGMTSALGGVIARDPVEAELDRVKVPTLVLAGEEDVAIVPERARRTADRIPGARFVAIPRAGHSSVLEEPDFVNRALDEFWSGIGG